MNKIIRYVVVGVVVLVFVAALTTYTVRFNETAVVSTFGRADENSVVKEEGLRFIWPYVQRVTKYDKRARYIETNPETAQTRGKRQLIVTVGLTWRVADPLKFYRAMSGRGPSAKDHYQFAEDLLKTRLRGTMGEVGQMAFDQILSASPEGSRLSDLETRMLQAVKGGSGNDQSLAELGIEPLSVGVVQLALPSDTSKKVIDAMNKAREAISNAVVTQGASEAATIRSRATSDAQRITKFAERLAESIRAQGDQEAQVYVRQQNEDPDLAVFLRTMEFMRSSLGSSTTLVLPTSMPGMEWFRPDALKRMSNSGIPGLNFTNLPPVSDDPKGTAQAAQQEGTR